MKQDKRCPKCGNLKSLHDFYNDKSRVDGKTPHCKFCMNNYHKKCVVAQRKANVKYERSIKGKITRANYERTKKGKEVRARADSQRKRNLRWFKLFENPFSEEIKIHWHHINNEFVVPLPADIHRICHTGETEKHRKICLEWIYFLYFGITRWK